MILDLLHCQTRDGVRLDGTLQSATGGKAAFADGVIFVHGTGGSFYSSSLFDSLADVFLGAGSAVLRVNTRGHDGISTAATPRGGRRQGAAYEVVDDCRHDLIAWIDVMKQRGHGRIALVGHSLGAVKCAYTIAHEQPASVTCLVALSPPRLSYAHFCASEHANEFLATFAEAESHVNGDRPQTLMDVRLPLPYIVSAAGYVDKYGPNERYNILQLVGRVACPSLVLFGSVEVENNMAFSELPELVARHSRPTLRVEVIAGADHFYTGKRDDAATCIANWLASVSKTAVPANPSQ